ncbi:hypothetical protein [Desulfobacter sp.]|uniref:hypothetical protein n=1 Tax=Desulfobacter sp. TaxID=2294 RepID=UPI000E8B9023|nr:hypothetical protein [Desulfobacter sp.]HBT88118.1 hypothetical protein [Desulfobacter sp.]
MPELEKKPPQCFVIQPFDGGVYDRRYKETVKPALEKAGVEPKRADEILGLSPVIEKIESAIAAAPICVAEVSEDNPNVWLELGYALALSRPTVILCEKEKRPKLPFDVQHRSVIFYRTDSASGFEELKQNIIRLVKHELASEQKIRKASVLKPSEVSNVDLKDFEVAILTTVFSFYTSILGGVESWTLENKLEKIGYDGLGLALGITTLQDRGFISSSVELVEDYNNSYDAKVYRISESGIEWIKSNQDALEIKAKPNLKQTEQYVPDDDIPF